mgnify:CR=1 FL=1
MDLDLPGLDWRLRDPQGPPTLVLRISRLQAHQRPEASRHARVSLLWSDPPLERQLRLITSVLPQARRIGVLYGVDSEFLLPELRRRLADVLGEEFIENAVAVIMAVGATRASLAAGGRKPESTILRG